MDSRATHLVTSEESMLKCDHSKIICGNNKVHLPTVDKADITHTGHVSLFSIAIVSNVLIVPDFKFNLLSISKMTKELSCSVNFFPNFLSFINFGMAG